MTENEMLPSYSDDLFAIMRQYSLREILLEMRHLYQQLTNSDKECQNLLAFIKVLDIQAQRGP